MKQSIILLFTTLLVFTSCSQKDVDLKTAAITIAFDSTQVVIGVSESSTLSLKQTPTNLPTPVLTWVSLSPDVATVNANGVIKGMSLGTTKIKVSSQIDESINAPCTIIVKTRGTSDLPYFIYTVQDLIQMRDKVNNDNANYGNKMYKLMADLDFSGESSWIPIGTSTQKFTGIFNGNGKIIKNIRIGTLTSQVSLNSAGLFGYINGGDVLNLGVQWSCLNAPSASGGIAGSITGGTISNCFSSGIIFGGQQAGGIVGTIQQGTILNCYSTSSCSITTNISEYSTSCGGIVGFGIYGGGYVKNCIALNSNLTAVTPSDSYYPSRIGKFSTTVIVSNNYASPYIIVKGGTTLNNLKTITSFNNSLNDGNSLIGAPVDLLNAYVVANPTQNSISLSKWKVETGVNNGYPIFK